MSLRSALFAVAALLAATAESHIIMSNPVPYSNDKIDNSPITKAQFPCKSQNGFTVTKMNAIKVGEKQQVSFKGTAVHGGGSCQLSYTPDTEPTANSKFKVIKSIEGGCPGVEGGTKTFDYTLPDVIPNGKGSFVWTWNSKMAGQPELYMNCAPIDVSGGASDDSGLDTLPDTLFANVGVNSCKQVTNKAIKFPNPGKEVEDGGLGDAVAPEGDCGSSGGSGDSSPAPGSGASSAPASKPTSAAAGQPSSAAAGQPSSAAAGQPSSAAAGQPSSAPAASKPTPTGGVFAPGASSAASKPTTLSTAIAPSAPAGTASPPAGTGAPSAGAPSTGAPSTGSPSTGAPSTGAPSAGGATGSCSEDGAIVCNGATQFGICNKGQVTWQAVAAGTQCANGVIAKRGYNGRIARPRY
ncbi:unnamed protein product [Periconia digitata]|uniref:Lytic polysaccharide monooxygenase n=1 Tax=Periconia digitata TaxID=1303443 RepID=A0A9W4UGV5_9PLEO|nr:unnamed protein product [Periconia digitata]